MTVLDRFLKYVSFETTSDPKSQSYPTTDTQKVLGAFLVEELLGLGLSDASMDARGYVTATLPGNCQSAAPTIGLIAHMDTSPAMSGKDIKPRVLLYEGGDVVLNSEKGIAMPAQEFLFLSECVGQHLVVTDGTTLLGADDKAGIAEIITAVAFLIENPTIPHGPVRLGFTPDEETGGGTKYFDVAAFAADFAYTVDGGALGELEYENFNAAGATVEISGVSIHPGSAKNKMKNACTIAFEFQSMLPTAEVPEHTDGYEGFFHLDEISGECESATLSYLVRDHDAARFEARIAYLERIADYLNQKHGAGTVQLSVEQSYRNMKEKILPHFYVVERALAAMEAVGVTPRVQPIRGGTDGARLSYMGLPCPNLGTGGYNFHGRYECASVEGMEKTVELLVEILKVKN